MCHTPAASVVPPIIVCIYPPEPGGRLPTISMTPIRPPGHRQLLSAPHLAHAPLHALLAAT